MNSWLSVVLYFDNILGLGHYIRIDLRNSIDRDDTPQLEHMHLSLVQLTTDTYLLLKKSYKELYAEILGETP